MTDEEIISNLNNKIEKINNLEEELLFKREQVQLTTECIKYRNCIEWIIHCNELLFEIKYALKNCLEYAKNTPNPLKESKEKKLYSFYLEDSAYRDLVLWDIYAHLVAEFYSFNTFDFHKAGAYQFFKNKKIQNILGQDIALYMESKEHKTVRKEIRNSFTHSIGPTGTFIFHKKINGKIKPTLDNLLPRHPFDNINFVVSDVLKLNNYLENTNKKIINYGKNYVFLYHALIKSPCERQKPVFLTQEYLPLYKIKKEIKKFRCLCDYPCIFCRPSTSECGSLDFYITRIFSNNEEKIR